MIVLSRHLGETRSGKKICAYDTNDIEYIQSQTMDYEEKDHFDAFCLFQFFSVKAVRQYGQFSDEVKLMDFMSVVFSFYNTSPALSNLTKSVITAS